MLFLLCTIPYPSHCRGDFGNSLLHYEQGITKLPEVSKFLLHTAHLPIFLLKHCQVGGTRCQLFVQDKEHDVACTGGVARMALKTGDIRRFGLL